MVSKGLHRVFKLAIVANIFGLFLLATSAHAWDCSVSISGLNTVEMGESISLTASGNRYGGTYSWSAWPYNLGSGQTINYTGKMPGKNTVWAYFSGPWGYCYSSKEITVTGEAWLKKVSGDNQKGVKESYLYEPLVVEVVDKNNKPIRGVSVIYKVKQSQPGTYWWEWGRLSEAEWWARPSTSYAYTDSSGRASRKLKLGYKLGTYAVDVSCANCTNGSPQTFTAEAVTVTLKKVSGDAQSGRIKKELKGPFVVKVTDATGAGVGGVYVSFSVVQKPSGSTGSYLSPSYTYTNVDGTASSTLILGDKTGDYKVNAYCYAASGGSPQTFTAKATQDIKIEIKAEKTLLSPLTDADNTGPSGARVIDFSKVRTSKVTVTVKQNDEPLPNHPIKVKSIPVSYSGGHDHNSNRRKGSFVAADGTETTGETTLKSDSNGIAEVTYKSSGIAGIETIEASSADAPDVKASVDVTLKIDGLTSMPIPSDNLPIASYYLVGSYGESGVASMHKNNHYGTWNTVNALVQIANGFNRFFPGNPLYYNDMSLPWGGPFDIYNNWTNPHLGHREGKNVDMRFNNVDTVGKYLELTKLLLRNNGRITYTHSDHWHIHFVQ